MLNLVVFFLPLLQNTHVVDAAGGAGSTHTDIPAAVAFATSGDTILVRAGTYSGFSTDKALTMLGAGAAVTSIVGLGSAAIINGDPSGAPFVLAGFECRGGGSATFGGVTVINGNLTLLDCELHGRTGVGTPAFSGFDSKVRASRCSFEGSPGNILVHLTSGGGAGAFLSASMFSADSCTFRGGDGLVGGPFGTGSAGPGLRLWSGDAVLSRCDILGGLSPSGLGGSGVECTAGDVRISGTASNTCQGGESVTLAASAGTIVVHGPIAVLPSIGSGTTTSGPVFLGEPEFPFLEVQGVVLPTGAKDALQPVMVTYHGLVANAPFFFLAGFVPDHDMSTVAGQVGPLLVDVHTAGLTFGTLNGAGQFSFSLLPAVVLAPVLGLPIYAQAGTFDVALGLLRTSNGNIERYTL